jgi:aryl-alcohol dehydrogenase-like predicted oxidoreductase
VQQGKVRYVGLSNETPWGVMKALHAGEHMQRSRHVGPEFMHCIPSVQQCALSLVFKKGFTCYGCMLNNASIGSKL